MTSSPSILKSGTFRPANRETVFCKTLVVGNTIAAYTATLAVLQAGGQVCWVQSGKSGTSEDISRDDSPALSASTFSWRLGRRVSVWETASVMSLSQQAFWASRQSQATPKMAPRLSAGQALAASQPEAAPSRDVQLRRAIAPYLENNQLILVPQGIPVRVLYAETKGQRRVHQVVFREVATKRVFQIHANLILDATRNAALQQLLAGAAGKLPPTELVLTPEHFCPTTVSTARGTFFKDAIALVMAKGSVARGPFRPVSIPMRALIPQHTEGFLCVTYPGCESALRPLFRHPRAQWALGEAVGHIAAYAAQAVDISALMRQPNWQWELQQRLVRQGIPIFAFDDVGLDDPDFEAIQMLAISDVVRTARRRDLSFRPETPVTRSVLASALSRLPKQRPLSHDLVEKDIEDVSPNHWAGDAIQAAIARSTMTTDADKNFAPSKVLSKRQLWNILRSLYPPRLAVCPFPKDDTPARRRHLSRALYPLLKLRFGR